MLSNGYLVSECGIVPWNPNYLPVLRPGQPATMEEAFTKLLRGPISYIGSLRQIKVLRKEYKEYNGEYNGEYDVIPVGFAQPVVQEILQQIQERRAVDNYSHQVVHFNRRKKGCGFCGETNHLWQDCYNLCRTCGEYGHFKNTCLFWKKFFGVPGFQFRGE